MTEWSGECFPTLVRQLLRNLPRPAGQHALTWPSRNHLVIHPPCCARLAAQHRMVDVIVTTAGGVEEDYIKVRGGGGRLPDAPRVAALCDCTCVGGFRRKG